jgi:repressor LexA
MSIATAGAALAGARGAATTGTSYTLLNRRPPAEADFNGSSRSPPPAVHQMIVELERRGLISRVAGQPRTIKVTVPDDELPRLQPIKTSAAGY